jgi:hypothetical protein
LFNLLLLPLQRTDHLIGGLRLAGGLIGFLGFFFFTLFGGFGGGILQNLLLHAVQLRTDAVHFLPRLHHAAATEQAIGVVAQFLRGVQLISSALQPLR